MGFYFFILIIIFIIKWQFLDSSLFYNMWIKNIKVFIIFGIMMKMVLDCKEIILCVLRFFLDFLLLFQFLFYICNSKDILLCDFVLDKIMFSFWKLEVEY